MIKIEEQTVTVESVIMEGKDEYQCLECGEWFKHLNNYSLCDDCEEEFQNEKKAIQDTQDSLNKQF